MLAARVAGEQAYFITLHVVSVSGYTALVWLGHWKSLQQGCLATPKSEASASTGRWLCTCTLGKKLRAS